MARPKKLNLRAVKGRTVPLEDGSAWPTEVRGKGDNSKVMPSEITVANTLYWRRRVRDGDVIDVDAEEVAKVAAAEEKKKTRAAANGGSN